MMRNSRISRRSFLKGAALAGAASFLPPLLSGCGGLSAAEATLPRKIAQMLLIGFQGRTIEPAAPLLRDIAGFGIGGVVLYESNISSPTQLQQLTAQLQSYAAAPLFIAVDQEGGSVVRLQESSGFPATVSARFLGDCNDLSITGQYADSIAATLAANGLNLNFAPVVDLAVNPASPAIGSLGRSFSADPAIVLDHARIFVERHDNRRVATCCKHFPGHGSATADSHSGFADVTATWTESELEPYRLLIAEGNCRMVMTGHVFNSRLDELYPATLSYRTVSGILRQRFGYNGVIVSDDMQMGAITREYSPETAVEKAILAGVDMLMFANSSFFDADVAAKNIELITRLVDRGSITPERINESYMRIRALKRRLAGQGE